MLKTTFLAYFSDLEREMITAPSGLASLEPWRLVAKRRRASLEGSADASPSRR
jgi:hypothetical protein